jgi:hypothetical protein
LLITLTNNGKNPSGILLAAWNGYQGNEPDWKLKRVAGAPPRSGTEMLFREFGSVLHPLLHATKVHGDNCRTASAPTPIFRKGNNL